MKLDSRQAPRRPPRHPPRRTVGPATLLTALLLGGLTGACDSKNGPAPVSIDGSPALTDPDTLASPAGPGSGEPNLSAGPGGVYLSWLEPSGPGRHALRFARWEDGAWGDPGTVIDRDGLFVNWADFPSLLALADGTLAAHWLQKSGGATYAYDVRMALSRDGGATWTDDVVPHRDGVRAEHGFVSLFPHGDSVGVVWLDGRETPAGRPMTLRATTLATDGGLGPEAVLDSSTCDCCQTGVATTPDGPVVVYRDRSLEEVRDIGIVRGVGGDWTEGRPVHEDGWVMPACPVNGPAVAAAGSRVAVAWFTAAGDTARVLLARSSDGGARFEPPVRVDDGSPAGRVALALLPDGAALVAWLERTPAGAEIRIRRVADGRAGPATTLTTTDAARASGFPRMVRSGNTVLFAWTEPGEASRVRTAAARLLGGAGEAAEPTVGRVP